MATAERLDIEESKNLVALEDLEGRDITCTTEGELAIHCSQVHPKDRNFTNLSTRRGSYPPLIILQKMQAAEEDILSNW